MFDIDYEWKLIYLVSFNRMCFLLLAINEVDVFRIWWNHYYDCMSDFAFGRRENVCWKELCWRQQQKEKAQKVAKLVSTTNNNNTSLHQKRRRRRRRICWCLLWCLLNFLFNYWSITKKYVVEKRWMVYVRDVVGFRFGGKCGFHIDWVFWVNTTCIFLVIDGFSLSISFGFFVQIDY